MSDEAENKPRPNRTKKKVTAVQEVQEIVVSLEDTKETPVGPATVFNPLRDEKIYIRPIRRKDGWLPTEHEANFLFKDSYFEISAQRDKTTGVIVNPLTEQEIAFFEDINLSHVHGLNFRKGDLSTNKKIDNVWWTHEGAYTIKLRNESKVLDLRNANEYILYKMLLSNKDLIAPTGEAGTPGNIGHKATFKYKIEKEGFEDQQKVRSADKIKKAYTMYGKIEAEVDSMITILSFANPGKRFPYSTSMDSLRSSVINLMETRIDTFLNIVDDQLFNKKVFLYKAIRNGFITKETGKIYITGSDELIGRTMVDAAKFLADVENQGLFIQISNKLRAIE